MFFKQIWSIVILCSLCSIQATSSNRKLRLVLELSRHGARSPIYNNLDADQWDIPKEQLTDIGLRQHYLIGTEVRRRYIQQTQFLSENINQDEIYIRSTDVQRTLQSAQAQLHGIYPQHTVVTRQDILDTFGKPPLNIPNIQNITSKLNGSPLPNSYQPIPIHTRDERKDPMIPRNGYCPNAQLIRKFNQQTITQIEFYEYLHQTGFMQQFGQQFGIPIKDIDFQRINEVYDTAYCNIANGRGLPNNITQNFYNWIRFINDFKMIYADIGSVNAARIMSGQVYKEILDNIHRVIQENSKLKFWYLSGHDDTLAPFLYGLGLNGVATNFQDWTIKTQTQSGFIVNSPDFASTIFIEVYQESQQKYSVKIIYNDQELTIKECGSVYCDLDTFENILSKLSIPNYDEVCQLGENEFFDFLRNGF